MFKNIEIWYTIISFIFLILFFLFFWLLSNGLNNFAWLYLINTMDIAIISLATFRLIRLVTYDKMFNFVRNWFLCKTKTNEYIKCNDGFRHSISELIECHWCTGLWMSLFATTLYFYSNAGRFFVIILAIAALGTFMQVVSKSISKVER